MATNVATIQTLKKDSKDEGDLKFDQVFDQNAPFSAQIEHLVRSDRHLSITRAGKAPGLNPGPDPEGLKILPEAAKKRLVEGGVDISKGYPQVPDRAKIPVFVDEAYAIRNEDYPYIERGANADPEKKSLFSAAKSVTNLTKHIGTEVTGLQLKDLTDKQKDELALLVEQRGVVFFRNQKLPPKVQRDLGDYWGQVEVHPQTAQVPGLPGITVIWMDYFRQKGLDINYKNNNFGNFDIVKFGSNGTQIWHTDLVHEHQPAGITHLHLDSIPDVGGDTIWASGYAAYDKLSEEFKKFLDGKKAVYVSAHSYLDRDDPLGGLKKVERIHPLVRTHPATGWKFLFVNRSMTKRIVGLTPVESDLILNYLFDVYEKNADVQVRWNWKSDPGYGTSAIWDNRSTQHKSVWDHEGIEARHGTRVTSLAEVPFFDPKSKSQREALGLPISQEN
ncbi:DEKNAAC104121 [Brettanomyces naardenensis]|uniref:DEKNAAC104121 n=1 Tax=Brettanomyces naardenensis TaxID=13370 RepID=A0A448YQA1_BRENA|nr:DEKNAAC104121 [Brettanomyces naardenensis]